MKNEFLKTVIAGIAATVAMTVMMTIGAQLGMPKMEPPKMLATTMGLPIAIGWVMHFMIGIFFALAYTYFFKNMLSSISSNIPRGAVFGIIALVIAQVGMMVMGQIFPSMPEPPGSMAMRMVGMLMGHILFGVITASIVKE